MSRSLIIIGGGIAGLAAGCYARMNNLDAEIHEMHSGPGGLCTAWKRQGYTCDLCIDWLCGSSPGSTLFPVWEELGVVQGRVFQDAEYYNVALNRTGERFTVWTDPDKLREEMIRISPEDRKFIDQFTGDIRKLTRVEMPVDPGFLDLVKMLPSLGLFRKYALPLPDLAGKIRNANLRDLFVSALDWNGQSAVFVMMMLAYMARRAAGYPLGGSLPVTQALEGRFLSLGGRIRYSSKVQEILVEDDRAAGVRLEDGTRVPADIVLSAADGYTTLFRWLPQKYITEEIQGYYRDLRPFPPLLFISFGVAADYSGQPRSVSFPLKKPFIIAGKEVTDLTVRNHSHDPTLAPPGKTVLSVMLETRYDYWEKMPYQTETYTKEKEWIGNQVLDAMQDIYPGIRKNVELIDVATPRTFVRYTGNWQGSYEGWLWTEKSMNLHLPQVLPRLRSFFMAGQWVSPGGGLPGAALSARKAVQLICKAEGRRFVTTKP
jgi:phytoene dehydrogenase-like protein